MVLAIVMKLRSSRKPKLLECFGRDPFSKTIPTFPPNFVDGTLPYSFQLCLSSESKQNEFSFLKPNAQISENVLCSENSGTSLMNNGCSVLTSKTETAEVEEVAAYISLQPPNTPFLTGRDCSLPQQPLLLLASWLIYDPSVSGQQTQPNPDWRFSQAQRPGTSGSQNGEEGGAWPNNQFDTEMLQAMILASANEAADGNSTLGGGAGTMGLSTRYGPQFTLQHVPDYRQNVYIPGSTATLSNSSGKRDGKSSGSSGGNKKKSGKKEKK
ncbi:protocadherin gamma-B1-like isoform X29 [Gopherus flavomarginatus]|uniref:protocadherin gamma-B1-like isoform X29 n=1 Tax=Gopherus flavomarginatus TaxID=286002 RepID=UPI0021CBECFD|nr:protocadherin gamma-B1-like isoform X29 [Gopherus flavomarginatus]